MQYTEPQIKQLSEDEFVKRYIDSVPLWQLADCLFATENENSYYEENFKAGKYEFTYAGMATPTRTVKN